jgi:hypothetical protein
MVRGQPTGAAMPLLWAHAEYVKLLRSAADGRVFDRVLVVEERYGMEGRDGSGAARPGARRAIEVRRKDRQVRRMGANRRLRVENEQYFHLIWAADDWKTRSGPRAGRLAQRGFSPMLLLPGEIRARENASCLRCSGPRRTAGRAATTRSHLNNEPETVSGQPTESLERQPACCHLSMVAFAGGGSEYMFMRVLDRRGRPERQTGEAPADSRLRSGPPCTGAKWGFALPLADGVEICVSHRTAGCRVKRTVCLTRERRGPLDGRRIAEEDPVE